MKAAAGNRTVLRTARLFGAVRALVDDNGPVASGWIHLATEQTDHGAARVVRLRGRRDVAKGWQVPTLLMDATMDIDLVRPYWPQARVTAEIEAETPHLRVRQVRDKTFSKSSMVEDEFHGAMTDQAKRRRSNNLADLRAVIGREARATNGKVLVVVPQAVETRLLELGRIPGNVDLVHHNSVAGQDGWGPGPGRDGVALTIIVGCCIRGIPGVVSRSTSTR